MTADTAPPDPRDVRTPRRLVAVVALVLAVGLGGTWALASSLAAREARADAIELDARTRDAAARAEAALRNAFAAGTAVRAFVAGQPGATEEEFRAYVLDGGLLRAHPRVSAVSFARWDEPSGRVVVERIEPRAGNEAAIGFDLLSEERRREAVTRARDRGVPSASAPITLVQDGPGSAPSVLLLVPVYEGGQGHATGPERRRNFLGVASMVLRTDVLLSGIVGSDHVVDLRIEDVGPVDLDGDTTPVTLYELGTPGEGATVDINAGDRRWRLTASPNDRFPTTTSARTVALVAGLVVTLGAALLVWTMGTGRSRAERLVAERTVQLRDANEQLREADRAKSAFLATVSHELRTPLTSILGFLAVLRRRGGALEDDVNQDLLTRMDRNSRGLLDLIEELLAFSRLERGHQRRRPERLDLGRAVGGAVDALSPLLEHARVETDLPAGLEVEVDPVALDRIVGNLVTNAARHAGPAPTIRVTVAAPDEHLVQVVVEDDGPGIEPGDRERVFEQFERGSARTSGPGTGIGLTVVRELARLQGGDAVLEESSAGARFVVTIPRSGPSAATPDDDPATSANVGK